MSGLAIAGVAYAEAQCGMWIARCPRLPCTNAMALDRAQPDFVCLGKDSCGMVAPVVWPADTQAIETVLMMRPVPITRNWLPHETVTDLLAENAEHGCLPPEWNALAGADREKRLLLVTEAAGRVTGGILHQQLEAAGRREIGA